MKKVSAGSVAPIVMCLLLAGIRVSDAGKDTITVPYDGTDFVINHYDDGHSSPFAVIFTSDVGGKSVYRFAKDGFVTDIEADEESYKLVYDGNGDLKKVMRTSSRRKLAADQADEGVDLKTNMKRTPPWHDLSNKNSEGDNIADVSVEELASSGRQLAKESEGSGTADLLPVQELTPAGRRRLYEDCEDCEQTWEVVCGDGVQTVCNLVGYGSPLLSTAEGSVDVFCTAFGTVCAERTASEVCDGECGEEPQEEEEECLPPLTITLEWSSEVERSGGETPLLLLYVIEPGGQTAFQLNSETDMGIISSVSSTQTYTLFEGLDVSSFGPGNFIAFAEWSEGLAPIDWTINVIAGDGGAFNSRGGRFTGDCSASSTSSSTYSYSDHGTSRGTTVLVHVTLFNYVDNGCL